MNRLRKLFKFTAEPVAETAAVAVAAAQKKNALIVCIA